MHFHGGLTPWVSDGGPFAWWDPTGRHGVSFLNNQVLNPNAAANEAEYYYPLNQSARFGWYHDHAIGITRINAYAGIASAIFIRDQFEASLIPKGLPDLLENGGHEIPLIFQDKVFVGANIATIDPTWSSVSSATTPGSLWYAHVYDRIAGSWLPAHHRPIRRSSRNSSATPCWSTARRSQRSRSNPDATVYDC